jgi:hypothetical protein
MRLAVIIVWAIVLGYIVPAEATAAIKPIQTEDIANVTITAPPIARTAITLQVRGGTSDNGQITAGQAGSADAICQIVELETC